MLNIKGSDSTVSFKAENETRVKLKRLTEMDNAFQLILCSAPKNLTTQTEWHTSTCFGGQKKVVSTFFTKMRALIVVDHTLENNETTNFKLQF